MLIINNESLLDLMKNRYAHKDISDLNVFLKTTGVLDFEVLNNGLFPAAKAEEETSYTGYTSVWVRDNIYIAHAHFVSGKPDVAKRNLMSLMAYFKKHRNRFDEIISGKADHNDPMNRPHIRFNGNTLSEIDQKWAHAQNDALGYFVWLYCKLANEGIVRPQSDDIDILLLFPLYWQSISYWDDEDSGHWEETRKVSASSIGVVVAALQLLNDYLTTSLQSEHYIEQEFLTDLTRKGREKLEVILPAECLQNNPSKYRRYDSALLFLIYPLNIVSDRVADNILNDVIGNLQGDYGIRRYLGDSYWSADYKKKLAPESRTVDFSDNISERDSLLRQGEEAQWCIFDPIISVIYGLKYHRTKHEEYLCKQIHYFNRSLGQITGRDNGIGEFLCPESYYLEDGFYTPSDPTPLYWTQANLMCAINFMERSLQP